MSVFAPTHEWSRLWTFTNYSGDAGGGVWPQSDSLIYLFALSLLLPIYTITGYDASAHTSEETYKAAHSVPRGIVHSVLWSVARSAGPWSAAIVIAIPDLAEGAKQGWNVFFNTVTTIMPNWLVQLLYLFILIAQFLCGLATVTSASRMIFAFSRDGGLPFISKWVSKVSPKYRTPVAAIWTGAVLEFLFVWMAQTVSIGGTNIYTIVVNATLIFLFLSFTVPIALGFFAIGTAKWPKMGPWDIGIPLYRLFAVLSVLCMALIIYIARAAAERQGALDHAGLPGADRHHLGSLREQALPGSADGRDDQEAPGRDPGGGEGGRRDLTLAKVA